METTFAFHSGSSDDFNPSIAVGFAPSGAKVFLNWAFTDTPAGTATTNVFAEGDASQPLVQIAGPGTVDATGGVVTGGATKNNAGSVTFRRCPWIRVSPAVLSRRSNILLPMEVGRRASRPSASAENIVGNALNALIDRPLIGASTQLWNIDSRVTRASHPRTSCHLAPFLGVVGDDFAEVGIIP